MNNKVLYNEVKAEKSFLTLINAAMSHQLRNPLNSLINQALVLKKQIIAFKKLMMMAGYKDESKKIID